ncbi:hypothetical protein P168DRAFT_345027 [Aspergillus campestris IBT 28561]|uniref:FAD-binding PCMH-type domain-containing protein n=1 Tax=Aspergillus campestris (strain IBT 28561) TaxID=1392248 RepID=A0A2I1D1T8_ASPC2|nr:uncharacterized protein P168DRAFT_345027 [Aspergillus campestris IBT 28561]PKY03818.1 hypothetical protein P168DRAFT_345027 [Aspergillus campestris IBT 28561]
MASIETLKSVLRQKAMAAAASTQTLSDENYRDGFEIMAKDSGWISYQDFIIPQLSRLLTPLLDSRDWISVLEIGPGPKSILGHLPKSLRQKIGGYTAFEPNDLFATAMEKWLCPNSETELPFPRLKSSVNIHRVPFSIHPEMKTDKCSVTHQIGEKYNLILFCHSMYGLNPKSKFIEKALNMLVEDHEGGIVAVFHRDGPDFGKLICHRVALFPLGELSVPDDDNALDSFAPLVAGFSLHDREANRATRMEWREACRSLGRRPENHLKQLFFSSPQLMAAFTKHSDSLPELTARVPFVENIRVKNWEARHHRPAVIVKPTEIQQVQDSGTNPDSTPLVVAEAGCKAGDIVRKTMEAGVTVPLGARPSTGAGLWLQGGIGHLARMYGLTCDAIVGVVAVSVRSGRVLCIGDVPGEHRPVGAVYPKNQADLLWAAKGAGTNIGIIISVTFKAFAAPMYLVRRWSAPLRDDQHAQHQLSAFDQALAGKLPGNCSADAYLYWENGQIHLGVTVFECSIPGRDLEPLSPVSLPMGTTSRSEDNPRVMNGVEVFDADMYMSGMHGGHGGNKTNSFKRCLFLTSISSRNLSATLVRAINTRPTPFCYLHLLHGGEAVNNVAPDTTAFGCRGWDYACVVTGVWSRNDDTTENSRDVVQWVYRVAADLLPLSCGVYGADLGPDPRDVTLAARAFGANLQRLAYLKHTTDPSDVLAYTSPLPKVSTAQKLIILVTGESGAGKDFCANIWVSVFTENTQKRVVARAVSISDATKREYAVATGANLECLLQDRAYKEQHRSRLTEFFRDQVRQRPHLPEEHLLDVVQKAADVDVLIITGMRDGAPVAAMSHLVPATRVLEVHVRTTDNIREDRRQGITDATNTSNPTFLRHCPTFVFENHQNGKGGARLFAESSLLPFLSEDFQRLAQMVGRVPNFPRPGVEFRHVLNIAEQPGGLALCISLMQSSFTGNWNSVDLITSCETGGYIFASALALQVNVPFTPIREAGKLPPPTIRAPIHASHISALASQSPKVRHIEVCRDAIQRAGSVVVVDDVLATGNTLYSVLQLLRESDICLDRVKVMVVVEFPVHRGRRLLQERGFGKVHIQSLLTFDGF